MPTTWLMRSKKESTVKESDFSQFDDARVREVMAAAATLLEDVTIFPNVTPISSIERLKTALFAAQHSKPKPHWQPQLANFCGKCGHIAWLMHLKEGLCLGCQETRSVIGPVNHFEVDMSKPGGNAFVEAVESKPRRTPMHRTHDDDGMPVDRDADGNDIVDD
jgi:hypothetical protein